MSVENATLLTQSFDHLLLFVGAMYLVPVFLKEVRGFLEVRYEKIGPLLRSREERKVRELELVERRSA